jgi:hypothetical protein
MYMYGSASPPVPVRRKPPSCVSSLRISHEQKNAGIPAIREVYYDRLKRELQAVFCSPAQRLARSGVVPDCCTDGRLRGRHSLRPRHPLHDRIRPPRVLPTSWPRKAAASPRRGRGACGRGARDGAPLTVHHTAVFIVVVTVDVDPHALHLLLRPARGKRGRRLGEHLELKSRAINASLQTKRLAIADQQ